MPPLILLLFRYAAAAVTPHYGATFNRYCQRLQKALRALWRGNGIALLLLMLLHYYDID